MKVGRLQRTLRYHFRDTDLLSRALTHSSYANEHRTADNERLEFLGDAVLELVVSSELVDRFPDAREGELSRLRSKLVNASMLAKLASRIELGRSLRMGAGETAAGGRKRRGALADAMEAVLGAVFVDGGFDEAREVARHLIQEPLDELVKEPRDERGMDPRSLLQQITQARGDGTPTYRVVSRAGPDHAPSFTVDVLVQEEVLGTGTGRSKREASRHAAEAAIPAASDP